MTTEKTALVVLGMHRSGTSSVAGALSILGARAPSTLMAAGEDNPRGFWESQVLMGFNDRLLAAGGSNWRDWRRFDLDAALHADGRSEGDWRAEALDCLRGEFGGERLIVLKDPRICRFYPFWAGVLAEAGYRARAVAPVRDPREAAASLMGRNGMGAAEAFRLWLRHVLDAEAASRGAGRRLLMWRDFLDDWRGEAARIEVRAGVNLDLDNAEKGRAVDAFLSADLRRQREPELSPPEWVVEAHETLAALAEDGEHPGLHRRMDALGRRFDEACRLFPDAPR